MNILLTTIFEFPHTGGLSTHMQTLKKGLEHLGHHVDTLSFSNVPYIKRKGTVQAPSYLMNRFIQGKGFIWSQFRRQTLLEKMLETRGATYDIISAQDIFSALAACKHGLPTTLTTHGYMAREAISKGSLLNESPETKRVFDEEKRAYQAADQIITVDSRIKNYVLDQSGVEAVSIPNFINVDDFQPDPAKKEAIKKELGINPDAQVLLVPRRLTKKNGVILPVQAMPAILAAFPDAYLIYAGDGEERSAIKKVMREQYLDNHVLLLGSVPHHKMKKYYNIADIVLIPSIHSEGVEEATSIAALEAMGSGAPVIAGAVGGLREMIEDGVDGIHVADGQSNALASATIRLLGNHDFRQRLADKARQKVETHYSHLSAAKRYAAIYQSVLENRGTSPRSV